MSSLPDSDPLVVLEQVNKHFGDLHVLQDVDLSVREREVVVVIGLSGSGKSTLCRAINRLEPIDAGTITFAGEPLPAEGKALAALRSDAAPQTHPRPLARPRHRARGRRLRR